MAKNRIQHTQGSGRIRQHSRVPPRIRSLTDRQREGQTQHDCPKSEKLERHGFDDLEIGKSSGYVNGADGSVHQIEVAHAPHHRPAKGG
jgi:hypothetical protein